MLHSIHNLPPDVQADVQTICSKGGSEADLCSRLYEYYAALGQKAVKEAFGPQRARWINCLKDQGENILALFAWLAERGEAERGLALAMRLEEFWFEANYTRTGLDWFERLLDLPDESVPRELRANACDLSGALALNLGEYARARALKETGVAIWRELDNPKEIGFALLHIGHLAGFAEGDFAGAQRIYQEALELLRAANSPAGIAHALADLGNVAILQGDYAAARAYVSDSLQRYIKLDDRYNQAQSLRRAAGIAGGFSHWEAALRLAGAGAAHLEVIGVTSPPVFEQRYAQMLAPALERLKPADEASLLQEGRLLSLDQAVRLAFEELEI